MSIRVILVQSKKELKEFIDFPHSLYADDANYVPEIFLAQKELHSKVKNPFFKHSQAALFLALEGNRIFGRIAAIHNVAYNAFHNSNVGFFGFFDSYNRQDVAKALLDRACDWCRQNNLETLIGPSNYSLTTDTGGLLVSGFDTPPLVMMTYNKRYYEALITQFGFKKAMDLYAYMIPTNTASDKSVKLSDILVKRLLSKDIKVRSLNIKQFETEVKAVKSIYEKAWEKNWGFNPPTSEEFDHLAAGLKFLIDPDFAYIAEHKGKPVGFAVSLPNINEVMIHQKRGRILPFGILRLLIKKKRTKFVRVALLGILPEYRKQGIEAVFYAKNINAAKKRNLIGGEASWILENNSMMIKALEKLGGQRSKTYRMFEYNLRD